MHNILTKNLVQVVVLTVPGFFVQREWGERRCHRSGDWKRAKDAKLCRGGAVGQGGTAHPCRQLQERNLHPSALPCLSSENRSMSWFSGARIRSRGAEAKTVHSAGSKTPLDVLHVHINDTDTSHWKGWKVFAGGETGGHSHAWI